jgi:hypothetical protein
MGGLGKWLFSKDIQNRIESLANLYKQWSDYDEKITKAETIIWNGGDYIPYLKNERDNLIKKEEAIIESYHQQAGLEINIGSSVPDRREGVVIQTKNNIENSVVDRRSETINRPENNIDSSVPDRREGVVIQTKNNIENSVVDRRAGTIIQTENELKKISNIKKQVINNKQSHQQPTNNRRKVGGDR